MTIEKKKYSLSKVKQLIDLNQQMVNFDIKFTVTASKSKDTFDLLVVDQTTLDNVPNLEYKKVEGEISGNIMYDKNVFQNHFLILRSEQPCECEITIERKEIPPAPRKSAIQQNRQQSVDSGKPGMSLKKIIFIVIGVLVIAAIGYFLFFRKKTPSLAPLKFGSKPMSETKSSFEYNPKIEESRFNFKSPLKYNFMDSPEHSYKPIEQTKNNYSNNKSIQRNRSQSLIDRLKKIKVDK